MNAEPELKADLLPEQMPGQAEVSKKPEVVVNRAEYTAERLSAEITICKAKHPSTKQKKYWAIVLGEVVGFEFDIRTKTRAIELAREELPKIKERRFEAIRQQMSKGAEAVADVVPDSQIAVEVAPVEGTASDAYLEMAYDDAQSGGA